MAETVAEHGRLLFTAAKRELAPLGFARKGRSRLWIADHRFWATIVEFQPSGWAKGSYLNVSAHWFWHPEAWSFDMPQRIGPFVPFQDAQQFSQATEALAKHAAEEAVALRRRFATLAVIAQAIGPRDGDMAWPVYHAAVAAGLLGDARRATALFARVAAETAVAEWHRTLQARSADLASRLGSVDEFRATILKIVEPARAQHGLAPDPDCLAAA